MKNHNTSLLIILFNSYDWSLIKIKYHNIFYHLIFLLLLQYISDYLSLFFDKYPLKMHLCFIFLTFISIHNQRYFCFYRMF